MNTSEYFKGQVAITRYTCSFLNQIPTECGNNEFRMPPLVGAKPAHTM